MQGRPRQCFDDVGTRPPFKLEITRIARQADARSGSRFQATQIHGRVAMASILGKTVDAINGSRGAPPSWTQPCTCRRSIDVTEEAYHTGGRMAIR